MAAPKSDETNRLQRRLEMVNYRKGGKSYNWIGFKFKIRAAVVRVIVLKACKGLDPKPKKTHRSNSEAVRLIRRKKMLTYRQQGLTYKEIAERFSISQTTVYKIVKRQIEKEALNDKDNQTTYKRIRNRKRDTQETTTNPAGSVCNGSPAYCCVRLSL